MAKITVELELSDAACANIMVTAHEGGIGYWAQSGAVVTSGDGAWVKYVSIQLLEMNDDEDWDWITGKPVLLDYDAIRLGVQRILSGAVRIRSDLRAQIMSLFPDNNEGDVDSEAADCIVQAGLLGELRYS